MGRNKATSNGLVANLPMANCKELIPSSRNQATVHRTVAFYSSSPYPVCQIKNTILLDGDKRGESRTDSLPICLWQIVRSRWGPTHRTTLHWSIVFDGSSPYRDDQIKSTILSDSAFYLATSNGLEPSTSSVTGWRANRLHHEAKYCRSCLLNKRNYSR